VSATDGALIAAMLYTFARVSAVVKLEADDYYHNGANRAVKPRRKRRQGARDAYASHARRRCSMSTLCPQASSAA